MNHDGEKPWTRQLLVAVGALLAVALVIGGVMSAFALGAAKVSGLGDSSARSTSEPSLVIPSDSADPGASPGAAPSSRTPSPRPAKRPAITLRVEPASVGVGQRINFSGDYPRGDGAELQVQRLEGAWTDFPVTTSVDGGRFATYITTSRAGDTRFRFLDKESGRASNVVRVIVG